MPCVDLSNLLGFRSRPWSTVSNSQSYFLLSSGAFRVEKPLSRRKSPPRSFPYPYTPTGVLKMLFADTECCSGWRVLKKISPRTSIPEYAVLVTVVIAIILSLVNIGDAVAFK